MPESAAHRTPFVLGTPIKNPADFFGRKLVLRELYDAILNHELVSVVGEHRCGNTSVIYQLLHEEQRPRYLTEQQDERLLFAFVSAQLASEGPSAFLRRVALSLRRADEEARVDFGAEVDQRWLENYLEDLADRGKRLVLLVDELEVLADLDPTFWEWFQSLVTEYDVAIVATTRSDLGRFRSEKGGGPPFFNMFRSVYLGSFTPETVSHFLREKSEITDFDFFSVRDFLEELAGRFPYYLQVAAALCYLQAAGDDHIGPHQLEAVRREFEARTRMLLEDAWPKLPHAEREALTFLAFNATPTGPGQEEHAQAMRSLERRGYVLDGRIFSSAFRDYVHDRAMRVSLNRATGVVRVDRGTHKLPSKQAALLAFFLDNEGEPVGRTEIERAVWPEHAEDPSRFTSAMLSDTMDDLRAVIEGEGAVAHLELLSPGTYRFTNFPLAELEP